jgi:hypothetical protein
MHEPRVDCFAQSQGLLKPSRSLDRVVALAARSLNVASACVGVPDGHGIVQYISFAGPAAGITRTPKVASAIEHAFSAPKS